MAIIARQTNQGLEFTPVNEARKAAVESGLASISSALARGEITPDTVFLGLASQLDELDGFGIFLRFYGRAMRIVSPAVILVLSIISVLVVLHRLSAWGKEAVEWIKKMVSDFWPFIAVGAVGTGAAYAWWRWGDEESERDAGETLTRIGINALRGFFLGLLPAPVAAVASVIVGEIADVIGRGEAVAAGAAQVGSAPGQALKAGLTSWGGAGGAVNPIAPAVGAISAGRTLASVASEGLKKIIEGALGEKDDVLLTGEEEDAVLDFYNTLD